MSPLIPPKSTPGFGLHDRACLFGWAAHITPAGIRFFPAPPHIFLRGAAVSLVQFLYSTRRAYIT